MEQLVELGGPPGAETSSAHFLCSTSEPASVGQLVATGARASLSPPAPTAVLAASADGGASAPAADAAMWRQTLECSSGLDIETYLREMVTYGQHRKGWAGLRS